MSSTFTGKTAIVTGGSRGIGAAISLELARRGISNLALTYMGNQAAAEDIVSQLKALGTTAIAIKADLVAPNFAEEVVKQTLAAFPSVTTIDILINNAARADLANQHIFSDINVENFSGMFLANVYAPMDLARAVMPYLPRPELGGGGRIINISSIGSKIPGPDGMYVYHATKSALDSFTRSMATQFGPKLLATFNSISVGGTNTDLAKAAAGVIPEDTWADIVKQSSTYGRLGEPSEVAKIVVFVASPEAGWMNGNSVPANGGALLSREG